MADSSRGRSSFPSRPPWEASSSGWGSLESSGPAGPPPQSSGQRVLSLLGSPVLANCSALGPSLRGSRGDPIRRLTAWVPPCSRSLQGKSGTDRASVSQAVACRGTPPLPPMSLGACRRCLRKQNSRGGVGDFGRARGAGPGPGGTWFAAGRGPAAGAKRRWGWPSCCHTIRRARKYEVSPDQPMELFRRGRPTPRALPGPAIIEAWSEGPKVLLGSGLTGAVNGEL